jgi:hypothetical protein
MRTDGSSALVNGVYADLAQPVDEIGIEGRHGGFTARLGAPERESR